MKSRWISDRFLPHGVDALPCLAAWCLALLAASACEKGDDIQGPAVEFKISTTPGIHDRVSSFTVRAAASDGSGIYCDPTIMDTDKLDGKSIVVHKGTDRFSNTAALRIEGFDATSNLVIAAQAETVFPQEGLRTLDILIDSACLNVSCSDSGMNFTRQCQSGDCMETAPAAGVFLDGGPIETETFCTTSP